jgi:hypothetical protein
MHLTAALRLRRVMRGVNLAIDFGNITENATIEKPAIMTAKLAKMEGGKKITDIDRPKGLFTDYRHVGDVIRQITRMPNL